MKSCNFFLLLEKIDIIPSLIHLMIELSVHVQCYINLLINLCKFIIEVHEVCCIIILKFKNGYFFWSKITPAKYQVQAIVNQDINYCI